MRVVVKPFTEGQQEIAGVFVGLVMARTETGRLAVRGFAGPHRVLVPRRFANAYEIGSTIRYRCALACTRDGRVGDVAIATQVL